MDYEILLKKYIQYIKDAEGTDYICIHDRRHESDVVFSEDEWGRLCEIACQKDGNG